MSRRKRGRRDDQVIAPDGRVSPALVKPAPGVVLDWSQQAALSGLVVASLRVTCGHGGNGVPETLCELAVRSADATIDDLSVEDVRFDSVSFRGDKSIELRCPTERCPQGGQILHAGFLAAVAARLADVWMPNTRQTLPAIRIDQM